MLALGCAARAELNTTGDETALNTNDLLSNFRQVLTYEELAGTQSNISPRKAKLSAAVPCSADEPIEFRHDTKNMGVRLHLQNAQTTTCIRRAGLTLFPGGGPEQSDVLVRERSGVVEDFIRWTKRSSAEVRYELELDGVQGLRLVDDTLEFYGDDSRPQLRMAKPFVIDADGQVRWAKLTLTGCSYSTSAFGVDAALPPPGSERCEIHVSWGDLGLRYPLILDPPTSSTDHLAHARVWHTATLLPDKRVLVTGGVNQVGEALSSTELYTPGRGSDEEGSWQMGPAMTFARCKHTATLVNGRVVVIGGSSSDDNDVNHALRSIESYLPEEREGEASAGTWLPEPVDLKSGRVYHSATLVGNNRIVIIGGGDSTVAILNFGEPIGSRDLEVGPPAIEPKRYGHTATELYGRVYVIGGATEIAQTHALDSAEAYDFIEKRWTTLPPMQVPRVGHTAVVLRQTNHSPAAILVVGTDRRAELLEPTVPIWSNTSNDLDSRRLYHTAAVFSPIPEQSYVLIVGGEYGSNVFHTSELYERYNDRWSKSTLELSSPRFRHTTTVLTDQRTLLVVGGQSRSSVALDDAEQAHLIVLGQSCSADTDCLLGSCADSGVCCNKRCDQPCETCLASESDSSDGTCVPKKSGTECREAEACSAVGVCNGTARVCPPSQATSEGEACRLESGDNGNCEAGSCVSKAPSMVEPTASRADPPTAFSCSIVATTPARRLPSFIGLTAFFVVALQLRRRKPRGFTRAASIVLCVTLITGFCGCGFDNSPGWDGGVGPFRDAGLDSGVGAGGSPACAAKDPYALELTWRKEIVANQDPGARRLHAMQAWKQGVLVVGGIRGVRLLSDTWHWTKSDGWSQLVENEPDARAAHALAPTPVPETLLLFGGNTAMGEAQDTWLWDGKWKSVCDPRGTDCAAPPARSGHKMVLDVVRQRVIMVAGTSGGVALDDTWEWSPDTGWRKRCGTPATDQISSADKPCGFRARYDHVLWFDATLGEILMVGGTDSKNVWNDVWAWNGVAWHQMSEVPSELGPRSGASSAYDAVHGMSIVVGGIAQTNITSPAAWAFISASKRWIQGQLLGPSVEVLPNAAFAYDVSSNMFVLQGGGLASELSGTTTLTAESISSKQYCDCTKSCAAQCHSSQLMACTTACERPSTQPPPGACTASTRADSGTAQEDAGAVLRDGSVDMDDAGALLSPECSGLDRCCVRLAPNSRDSCEKTALRDDREVCKALAESCRSLPIQETPESQTCWELSSCCVDLKDSLRQSCIELVLEASSCGGLLNGGFCPEVR